jgi:hypothetical protein
MPQGHKVIRARFLTKANTIHRKNSERIRHATRMQTSSTHDVRIDARDDG